jgi:predicted GIY-YIG superfamily endonuclease
MNNDKYVVYKYFDKDNNLLYIGITNDMRVRVSQHKRMDKWFKEVSDI